MALVKTIKQIRALCVIRFRLLLNNIRNKAGLGKILGMSLAAIIMVFATASGASDIIEGIYKLPYANIIAEWGIGLLVLYGIFVVFTGDLVSGHSLNTGQMSSDFNYLTTLPISPTILILTKQFERLITDYFGILFLLPALIGISCYKAFSLNAVLTALLIYFEISFAIGLMINLTNICLTRFFKTSTINNFYSIFGYVSAILTLIPFLMVSNFNPSHVPMVLDKIAYLEDNLELLMMPIKWVGNLLLNSTPFSTQFVKISLLWFIAVLFLTFLFHEAVKNNWFNYVHSSKVSSNQIFKKRLLSGLFWKEWLMLKSDLNLLVNAIFMPISIIAIEIYFLKQVFSLKSVYSIMNFIFGSIIYFSLFGPINIIGYEGKAISLLESMPISPSQLIKRKYAFWVIIALIIFIPSAIVTFKSLGFYWDETLKATFITTLFTLGSVWVAVCFSAIFAIYDTAVLQQHSSFWGKMAAMTIMTILLPLKNISLLNIYSLLVFITMISLCYLKAQSNLAYRQDKEALNSENNLLLNSFILLFSFVVIENNIKQFFFAIVPDTDTGIWSWWLSLTAMFFFVILARKKGCSFWPKPSTKSVFKAFLVAFLTIVLTIGYFAINQGNLIRIRGDLLQIIDFFSIIKIIKPIWTTITFFMFVPFMIAIIRRIEENFFTKSSDFYTKALGITLAVLLTTKQLMPAMLIFMLVLQLLKGKEDNQSIVFYSSLAYFSFLYFYLVFC